VDRAVGLQRDARRSRPRRPRHVVVPRKAWRTCTCLMRGMWWWVVRWFIACPNNIVSVVDDDDDGKDPCVQREDFEAPNIALCNTIPSQATSFDWQVVRMLLVAVWYYSLGGPGGGLQAGYAWLSHPPCCLGRSHTQAAPTHPPYNRPAWSTKRRMKQDRRSQRRDGGLWGVILLLGSCSNIRRVSALRYSHNSVNKLKRTFLLQSCPCLKLAPCSTPTRPEELNC
jgi:hypothetical protein